MTADTALFDITPFAVELAPALSPGQRRVRRQEQAMANGVHPLGLALRHSIRIHPDAPRDRAATGPRCGTCWYRRLITTNGNRDWPKCTYGAENWTDSQPGVLPRVSHGPGTDVRRWWPACVDYSPGEPALSDDAARYVPEVPA